jgi:hypothetical protein
MKKHEAGLLQGRWKGRRWRSRRIRSRRSRGRVSGRNGVRSGKSRPGSEGLGRWNARRRRRGRRRKHFLGQGCTFAQMRFGSKEVLVKDSGGTDGAVARALSKNMVGVAAEHTTGKAMGVGTLEVGGGVDRKGRFGVGRGR